MPLANTRASKHSTEATLIPKHGGYRSLKSFQVAQVVYDVTVRFCDRGTNVPCPFSEKKRPWKESIMITRWIIVLLILCLPVVSPAQKSRKAFAYDYTIDDLPNGLRLITVPTDYPNLVALQIVVQTGSRNEPEKGRSGYAHLFEHLMFRGSEHYDAHQRDEILKKAGANDNAYTSDDRTVYHEVFSKDDLDKILELEADRFQHLKYPQDGYKTETKAVLVEFNKNSAAPEEKLFEVLRATAYQLHTYAHTTMGFIEDIEDMPNQYDYSLQFYSRYYRPEYATIVLVGDVKHDDALALLAPIAFGENSDLYQKLVLKEQKVDQLSFNFDDRADPELFFVNARVKDEKDMNYVRQQILDTYQHYTKDLVPQAMLDSTRSRLRYGFALGMNSSEAIADSLASYVGLRRTPLTIDKLFSLYDAITPKEIRDIAAQYFVDSHRTIVTLSTKKEVAK